MCINAISLLGQKKNILNSSKDIECMRLVTASCCDNKGLSGGEERSGVFLWKR